MKVKSGPNNDKKQHGEKKKFPPLSKKSSKKQRRDITLMTVHKDMNSCSNETDAKYLKEENMKLKEQRMCKVTIEYVQIISLPVFRRVHATLHSALSIGWSVGHI